MFWLVVSNCFDALCSTLLARHSLLDTTTALATPCSTFLAQHCCYFCYSLFNIACSRFLAQHFLFDTPCSALLLFLLIFVQHYYCCSLFDIACSMLLVWCSLTLLLWHSLMLMLLLLLLTRHRCFFCYSLLNIIIDYSLFDATILLVIPCLMMLLFLLFLAQCCCSSWYSLFDIVASLIAPCLTLLLFLMILCSFILDMACSCTSLVCSWCYSLLVVSCSTFLLIFILFQINISPL